jgi:hypothetical protein
MTETKRMKLAVQGKRREAKSVLQLRFLKIDANTSAHWLDGQWSRITAERR